MAPPTLPTLKLLLIGPSSSGKTALLLRYTSRLFNNDATATIGVDFRSTLYPPASSSSSTTAPLSTSTSRKPAPTHKLLLFDTAGQERFRTLTASYYRDTSGVLLVYDVTNRASFLELQMWIEEVWLYSGRDTPVVVVGNKIDRCNATKGVRAVEKDEARKWAEKVGAGWGECSAKTGEGVDEVFERLVERVVKGGWGGGVGRKVGALEIGAGGRSWGMVPAGCSC